MSKKAVRLGLVTLGAAVLLSPPALWAQEEDSGASINLATVVVTASRTAESLRELPVNATIINEEQIRRSTAKSMDQLLVQQGFQVANQGTQKVLKIRGIGQSSMGTEMQSNVLVLLNGRRIGGSNVGAMGLANVERIEIIRGPSAVQYGSSAMGGVVNIITKRGEEGFRATAEAGFGSFGMNKQELSFSGGTGTLDFSAAITRQTSDDIEVKGGHKWRPTAYDRQLNGNFDLGFSFLEKHRIGLNYNAYELNDAKSANNETAYCGGWSCTGAVGYYDSDDYNLYDYRNTSLTFSYEGAAEDDRFNWSFTFSKGQDEKTSLIQRPTYLSTDSYTLDNSSLTVQAGYSGELLSLSGGFDYLEYDVDGDNEAKALYKDYAGFLSGKMRLMDDKLIFSAGARYDSFKLNGEEADRDYSETNLAPSVGVAFLPVEWLKLRANYSEGFRLAAPKEIFGSGAWYLPNFNLDPEKSKTYEIGADVTWEFFQASLTYFQSEFKNKIAAKSTDPSDWNAKWQYVNFKAVDLDGLEFSTSLNLGQAFGWDFDLTPYANLTYMLTRKNKDAEFVRTEQDGNSTFTNVPKLNVAYGVNFNHPGWELAAGLNAVYYGKSVTKDGRLNSPTQNKFIATDDGTVVNLSLDKKIFDFNDQNSVSLRFEANNIFDEKNEAHLDYPGPGRNFYAGLRYSFN